MRRSKPKSEELELLILKDKKSGMSDRAVCQKYGINLDKLEEIIRRHEGINISMGKRKKLIKSFEPENFELERTTVWSFPVRGAWATHSGGYRGNWSPFIPRNLMLAFSDKGDVVLDYFCGSGTTAIEAKLLGRRCIAVDINENAVKLTKEKLNFSFPSEYPMYEPEVVVGDARNLSFIGDNSVDFICAHPPYANAIKYSENIIGDLSHLEVGGFLGEMEKVASESYRVLKPGKYCAILIGDLRKNKKVQPLGFKLIDVYLNAGFRLKHLIIKLQHNCKTTGIWFRKSEKYNFLILAHEYLPIFEKTENHSAFTRDYRNIDFTIRYTDWKMDVGLTKVTSVWIYSPEAFEDFVDTHLSTRYGVGTPVIVFPEMASVPLNFFSSLQNFIDRNYSLLSKNEFIVFQMKDIIEPDGYVFPMAGEVVKNIKVKGYSLKEIIILVPEDYKSLNQNFDERFKLAHSYLLVYWKTGGK